MSSFRKYLNSDNWNIGFTEITPQQLVVQRKIGKVHWMKHPYKDRFFADPFILRYDNEFIYVLVVEMKFHDKGVISLLKVCKKTYALVERKVILDLPTHLSYPIFFRVDNKVFMYPENSASGNLTLYEFDEQNNSLLKHCSFADFPLTDATIFRCENDHAVYMLSTIYPQSQQDAFLFRLNDSTHKFELMRDTPVVSSPSCSRCGGAFFRVDNLLYRPAQNCSKLYGGALKIMNVKFHSDSEYTENEVFELKPISWKYNLGIHTINFSRDNALAVVDGYGYLYPIIGRILTFLYNIKHRIQ